MSYDLSMKIFIEDYFLNMFLFLSLIFLLFCYVVNIKISKKRFLFSSLFFSAFKVYIDMHPIPKRLYHFILLLFFAVSVFVFLKNINTKSFLLSYIALLSFYHLIDKLCSFISLILGFKFNLSNIESILSILIVWCFSFILIKAIKSLIQQFKIKQFVYDLEIKNKGKKIKLKAYLDTGNMLVDNVSNKPVIIINFLTYNKLLGKFCFKDLFFDSDKNKGYHIEYKTVSGKSKMFVFKPDDVFLISGTKKQELDVVLGVTLKGFGDKANFDALLNPYAIKL